MAAIEFPEDGHTRPCSAAYKGAATFCAPGAIGVQLGSLAMNHRTRLYLDAPSLEEAGTKTRLEFDTKLSHIVGGVRPFSRLVRELHPVRCQTCHDPLGASADICGDRTWPSDELILTLHHPNCRSSETYGSHIGAVPADPSATASAFLLKDKDLRRARRRQQVIVVVNPSCEQVVARQVGLLRRGRNIVLDDLRPLGFTSPGRDIAELAGVTAALSGSTIVIDAPTTHEPLKFDPNQVFGTAQSLWNEGAYGTPAPALAQTWTVDQLSNDVREALETKPEVIIAATTRYLPTQLTDDTLARGLAVPGLLLGSVTLQ